ncbi:MAG TPA: hypothetical protein VD908_15355 [Cytophagales bacterium]|nr:hypothetical protein [Cytophagales bacterium]
MKTSLAHTFITVFLIFVLFQCDDKETKIDYIEPSCLNQISDTVQAKALIVGEWDWILTHTLIRGQASPQIENPETNGSKKLIFGAGNTVEIIEKDNPNDVQQYSITKSSLDSALYIYFVKTIDNTVNRGILKLCADTMVIDYSYNDSDGKELYVRE